MINTEILQNRAFGAAPILNLDLLLLNLAFLKVGRVILGKNQDFFRAPPAPNLKLAAADLAFPKVGRVIVGIFQDFFLTLESCC